MKPLTTLCWNEVKTCHNLFFKCFTFQGAEMLFSLFRKIFRFNAVWQSNVI